MADRRVPGHGSLDSQVALVGEAPGKDEHAYGIPFVGPSGELLSDVLGRSKLHRRILKRHDNDGFHIEVVSNVYTTNVVKYFPDGDFAKIFYQDSKATIPTDELLFHYEELRRELVPCKANVIGAVGEHALRALTGKRGITKWRGSILESSLLPGRKVVPLIHPAHVLREWSWRSLLILDMKRVAEESASPVVRLPHRSFIIHPTLDQVIEAEERLCHAQYVALDIETKYNNIACIGFADSDNWAICIPLLNGSDPYWINEFQEARVWRAILNICQSPAKKILQNALFDLSHLWSHGVRVSNVRFDTMVASKVIYPEMQKSLALLTSIYTREPYYKEDGKEALSLKSEKAWDPKQSDNQLWIYNCKDCCVTYEIAMKQLEELREG